PLTGAFYAFEVVIGAYTPAAIGPVALACLVASIAVRAIGAPGYSISLPTAGGLETASYVLFAALGILCGVVGVAIMRLVTLVEAMVRRGPVPEAFRPFVGGLCMIPLAMISPQALSAGHGALHLDMNVPPTLAMLATIFAVKVLASAVSLGFGFRGGMFFASLFLGSLAGQMFIAALSLLPGAPALDANDAALVGMAGMAVAIVGAPLTMAMLVLESTHDFTLAAAALVAAVSAATIVRETFGFSFSTWRMHTRGETIRSARDVSWIRRLTAGSLMRRGVVPAPTSTPLAEARRRFPLGTVSHVVLAGDDGVFAGIVPVHTIHTTDRAEAVLGDLAQGAQAAIPPESPLDRVLRAFDAAGSEVLVVIDHEHRAPIGLISESDVRRRYAAEMERAQRELFGE
ncbi:MAG TPA: chloride channel protein, partial [Novosphingobium sp.]|nr:chloride channel protein [Novosphingobium sp.]